MTRVSDVPGFAEAVAARAEACRFVALAMLRGAEVRALSSPDSPAGSRAGPGAWASSGSSRPSSVPSSSRRRARSARRWP